MADAPSFPPPQKLTGTHWLILIMAAIGFAFDIYELLMLPLILRPALFDLLGVSPGDPLYTQWARALFFLPALAGGVFGFLGGYLTDRFGRRRVLVWSILLYALSAFAAGFSTSVWMLFILRCTTFIGVCVEFVAAVAWLAELFPNPRQREQVLGYTQAFSSFGGLLVAVAFNLASTLEKNGQLPALSLPAWAGLGTIPAGSLAWRYTLMSGLIPALPLLLVRPFMPESPAWQQKKAAGTLRRPNPLELFRPRFLRTTLVTALMFACSYGAAFGAIQHLPQIVPGLPEVSGLSRPEQNQVVATVQTWQELGGLTGRFLFAVLAVYVVSRRNLLRVFQLPGLFVVPLVFLYPAVTSLDQLKYGIFLAGLLTVAQFSFWGNYLPLVYPVHLRGTGESFAANIGGRIFGTSFALVTITLAGMKPFPEVSAETNFAYVAAGVALFVYAVGTVACFFLPEPGKHDFTD